MSSMFGFHDDYIVVQKKAFHYSGVFFYNHLCQRYIFIKNGINRRIPLWVMPIDAASSMILIVFLKDATPVQLSVCQKVVLYVRILQSFSIMNDDIALAKDNTLTTVQYYGI